MYEIRYEVSAAEWDAFVEAHPAGDLLQLSAWAEAKKPGWQSARVGIYSEGRLCAGAQLLFRRLPLPGFSYTLCYAPRGPLVDLHNSELTDTCLTAIEAYARKHGALSLCFDPAILRSEWEAELLPRLGKRGYKHAGFSTEMNEIQPRCNMMLDLSRSLEERRSGYASSLRNKVNKAARTNYVRQRLDEGELGEFFTILQETGERDHIGVRNQGYYESLLKAFKLEGREDFHVLSLPRPDALAWLEEQLAKKPGDEALLAEKAYVEGYPKENIPLACSAVLYCGKHAYYLYGGSSNHLRKMYPVFGLLPPVMEDAIAHGCTIFDFGGVSGETDVSKDPRHGGLYTFKRQWGAELVEYVGEFEKPLRPLLHGLFRLALRLRKKLRAPGHSGRQFEKENLKKQE